MLFRSSRRTYPLTFLSVFDYPIMDTNCTRRVPSATPLQSLTMMNDEFVVGSAGQMADRVNELVGADASAAKKIEAAYLLALARKPADSELSLSEDYLKRQEQLLVNANVAAKEARERALASLTQTLLSTNEFLYVE